MYLFIITNLQIGHRFYRQIFVRVAGSRWQVEALPSIHAVAEVDMDAAQGDGNRRQRFSISDPSAPPRRCPR